mmetsp:Transcript_9028/g.28142  ORF Transcript_9028/g.28142 Transcript_9028/m.28142 type:complete len:373 (-) Transcript_9028:12-1130(-)
MRSCAWYFRISRDCSCCMRWLCSCWRRSAASSRCSRAACRLSSSCCFLCSISARTFSSRAAFCCFVSSCCRSFSWRSLSLRSFASRTLISLSLWAMSRFSSRSSRPPRGECLPRALRGGSCGGAQTWGVWACACSRCSLWRSRISARPRRSSMSRNLLIFSSSFWRSFSSSACMACSCRSLLFLCSSWRLASFCRSRFSIASRNRVSFSPFSRSHWAWASETRREGWPRGLRPAPPLLGRASTDELLWRRGEGRMEPVELLDQIRGEASRDSGGAGIRVRFARAELARPQLLPAGGTPPQAAGASARNSSVAGGAGSSASCAARSALAQQLGSGMAAAGLPCSVGTAASSMAGGAAASMAGPGLPFASAGSA